jgi:glycosyltransferase involved in cell wall biosynthesis
MESKIDNQFSSLHVFRIAVIICTHNPRRIYLERVLSALKDQTLDLTQWELILVDNASDQSLASEFDLNWHPHGRHISEPELGLTKARLKGIYHSAANILVFVDDDNILALDYLEIVVQKSQDWPTLGAWGGQVKPEFEQRPPEWTKPYWGLLALREFSQDRWSNLVNPAYTTPCGAGLCVRRVVAEKYIESLIHDPKRINLDRCGKSLSSGGDSDLALTACDMQLGTGLFIDLKLTHLIPAKRLEESYLLRLVEELAYSDIILRSLRDRVQPEKLSKAHLIFRFYIYLRMSPQRRRFYNAEKQGRLRAFKDIALWESKAELL